MVVVRLEPSGIARLEEGYVTRIDQVGNFLRSSGETPHFETQLVLWSFVGRLMQKVLHFSEQQ